MKLSILFRDKQKKELGRFVEVGPNPSNKEICDAKHLLRDNIELEKLKLKDFRWVINAEEGKVGWYARMV